MGMDAYITLAVIAVALVLFVLEIFSIDLVALGIIVVLSVTGVISPAEGLAGFSNKATVTVAAMFVLSYALIKTQVVEYIGPWIGKLFRKGFAATILGLAGLVGVSSAFVNNTPIVATFIPIVSSTARKSDREPGRYLIPLSFLAIFGGLCTLIGTSTNLLVSSMAEDAGVQGFSMFTLTPFGLVLFVAGTIYLLLFGKKLVPLRTGKSEEYQNVHPQNFLAKVKLKSKPTDMSIAEVFEDRNIKVNSLQRDSETMEDPQRKEILQEADILMIAGDFEQIKALVEGDYFSITRSAEETDFDEDETRLIEIILLPNSELVDKKLSQVDFLNRFRATPIAIRQRGMEKFKDLEEVHLRAGDVLVLLTNQRGQDLFHESQQKQRIPFLSLREVPVKSINKFHLFSVLLTIATVIALASTGVLSIAIAALGGIVALTFMGILHMGDIYRAIDWKVIFLLAGSLSLGKAMSSSGLSNWIAENLTGFLGEYGHSILFVALFYILTSVLTEIMSNNASAALMVPIAISTAESLSVDVLPLLLTIAFAGSASFMTPIGYQTNTMVYSAGRYKFADFARVGVPLNLLFWVLASLLIPFFYPF